MIDVVFLLIIFFLVSSHLVQQESLVKVDLPQAASADAESSASTARLTVTALADGSLYFGSQPGTLDDFDRRLAAMRAQRSDPIEVRIRGSRDLPYRLVEPLMVRCAAAEVWNLTFAVHEPEGR
jgi:biopolymer transport protein ExbD